MHQLVQWNFLQNQKQYFCTSLYFQQQVDKTNLLGKILFIPGYSLVQVYNWLLQRCRFHSFAVLPQVIEIPGLTKHWLTECEFKALFRQCPLCKDAILIKQFDSHVEAGNCLIGPRDKGVESSRCPLCHRDIPDGEEASTVHTVWEGSHPAVILARQRSPPHSRPSQIGQWD